jgi:hypothetical protein
VIVKSNIGNAEELTDKLVDDVRHRISAEILTDMLRVVPRDTGDLADSLGVDQGDDDSDYIGSSGYANGHIVDYAGYVEMGTSRMAAEPYMRPALYKNRSLEDNE